MARKIPSARRLIATGRLARAATNAVATSSAATPTLASDNRAGGDVGPMAPYAVGVHAWLAKMSLTDTVVGAASAPTTATPPRTRRSDVCDLGGPGRRPLTHHAAAAAIAPPAAIAVAAAAPVHAVRIANASMASNVAARPIVGSTMGPRPTEPIATPITTSRIAANCTFNLSERKSSGAATPSVAAPAQGQDPGR